jgi:hypothetical protein
MILLCAVCLILFHLLSGGDYVQLPKLHHCTRLCQSAQISLLEDIGYMRVMLRRLSRYQTVRSFLQLPRIDANLLRAFM